jgi:hypothetical protein
MICPVEIARDMSALRAARMGDHAEHGSLSEGRDGAGDESTGRDVAGDGEEDHLVSGIRKSAIQLTSKRIAGAKGNSAALWSVITRGYNDDTIDPCGTTIRQVPGDSAAQRLR